MTASADRSIADLVVEGAGRLRGAGIEDSRAEARWLLGHVLGLSASQVILQADRVPPSELVQEYCEAVRRRAAHEPFAYVVGEREFYGRSFLVDRRVLVPRPETETLIEAALDVLASWERGHPFGKLRAGSGRPVKTPNRGGQDGRAPRGTASLLVIDVGTGSGAIACTLALEMPTATVVGCDLSADALAVAGANRDRLGLRDRLALVRGSLLSWLDEPADLVVANLPYIPTARVPTLMPEVADWEPRPALDGGADGLDLVRALLADAPRIVRPGGTILLEGDPEQMAPASALVPAARATVVRDLASLDRVLRLDLP